MTFQPPVRDREGTLLTHFLTVSDQDRSRRFYADVLRGQIVLERDPCIVKLANSWIILNVGGGPTDDKPEVTLAPPRDDNTVSSFLNIRVADIMAVMRTGALGARSSSLRRLIEARRFAATCVTLTDISSRLGRPQASSTPSRASPLSLHPVVRHSGRAALWPGAGSGDRYSAGLGDQCYRRLGAVLCGGERARRAPDGSGVPWPCRHLPASCSPRSAFRLLPLVQAGWAGQLPSWSSPSALSDQFPNRQLTKPIFPSVAHAEPASRCIVGPGISDGLTLRRLRSRLEYQDEDAAKASGTGARGIRLGCGRQHRQRSSAAAMATPYAGLRECRLVRSPRAHLAALGLVPGPSP